MATLYYRPFTTEPVDENAGDLPADNALEGVLPDYKYIFVDPDAPRPTPGQLLGSTDGLPSGETDRHSMQLLDYQMKELEKYRTAVHKMGQDILTLRQQMRDLESENSQLRRDLAHYNDTTRMLMDSQDLDGLTKPELAARYVTIKHQLSRQTGELKDYKSRVQKLQNQLIQKNDKEKQFYEMSEAHQSQNKVLQKLNDKVKKVKQLEDTVKKQERVIEKLEKLATKGNSGGANEALMEENQRLRSELESVKAEKQYNRQQDDDLDKLDLYQKLEKADARIISLERQLAEDSRRWARERSDLLLKLRETEHGFRTPPEHEYRQLPAPSPRESYMYPSKPSRVPYGSQRIPYASYRR